ncbi:PQQ-binding-like beta-propeller repeat protein [Mucilaginibacter sp. SP1R1]|uniref:beta-alanine-activating enzyme beta-propeller domain-containing protein n=1 Tax=Mucilaginibacter sp. SP1R1 TaxID=2723091 RepID=UPI0016102FF4|nr:PQQ-binding-like beta-propeller repeat protein [Mucilaginibacter sp. SP1R1]MBB6150165.1 outer membrane protein assembly factor BamB [Mucilaginibacter sp. SP1R1]
MFKYLFAVAFLWLHTAGAQNQPNMAFGKFQSQGTGINTYTEHSYTGLGAVKWNFKTRGEVLSSPAICNGIVYIGSQDHNLYAINIQTGKPIWEFATGGTVNSSPVVYKNTVYFGSFDGLYYALNALTGKQIWKFKTAGERKVGAKGLWGMGPKDQYMEDQYDFFLSSPVLDLNNKDLTVYFGSSDGNLYALNAHTGKKKWAFKTNGIIRTSPALYQGKVYIGSWDTFLYALDAHTGKLQWKFETRNQPVVHLLEGIQSSPACASGMVYMGSRDGFFYALNAHNGKQVWKYDANGSWVLTTAVIKNGMVYFGTSDTFLFLAFDAKTGKEKLRYKTHGYVYSSPAITGNTAYFGDFSGSLLAVDLNTGRLNNVFSTPGRTQNAAKILNPKGDVDFSFLAKGMNNSLYATSVAVMDKLNTLGPIVSSPAVNNGVIYFGSVDGYLYAVNLK